jgi:hypothetical protein
MIRPIATFLAVMDVESCQPSRAGRDQLAAPPRISRSAIIWRATEPGSPFAAHPSHQTRTPRDGTVAEPFRRSAVIEYLTVELK